MNKSTNNLKILNDSAILVLLGNYVKQKRLEQNKSQDDLANEAGINISTLKRLENGNRSNTLTLIQILRALNSLNILESFQLKTQVSPLLLAKLERKKRLRATRKIKKISKSI